MSEPQKIPTVLEVIVAKLRGHFLISASKNMTSLMKVHYAKRARQTIADASPRLQPINRSFLSIMIMGIVARLNLALSCDLQRSWICLALFYDRVLEGVAQQFLILDLQHDYQTHFR
jgi:hypothetical protein